MRVKSRGGKDGVRSIRLECCAFLNYGSLHERKGSSMVNVRRYIGLTALMVFILFGGWAQEHVRVVEATELFKAQKWTEAAKAYSLIVADDPRNVDAWRNLGMSYFQLKEYDSAVKAFQEVVGLAQDPNAMYNIACSYALSGKPADALEWLEKSVASNITPFVFPEKDTDLKSLYELARFKEIVTSLDRKRRPCQYSAEARQFDFWLGSWDVFNPQGLQAGTSEIVSVSEGCGILEQWKNRGGTTGTSLNFYDAGTKKWYQYWMGATGVATRYEGEYRDGAMRYQSENVRGGKKTLLRLTFFNVDVNTVRQFAEQSVDEGKTWTVSYDFKYVRKKKTETL